MLSSKFLFKIKTVHPDDYIRFYRKISSIILVKKYLAPFYLPFYLMVIACNPSQSKTKSFMVNQENGEKIFVTTTKSKACTNGSVLRLSHFEPISNKKQIIETNSCQSIQIERKNPNKPDSPTNFIAAMNLSDVLLFSQKSFCPTSQEKCIDSQNAVALLYLFARQRDVNKEQSVTTKISQALEHFNIVPEYLGYKHMVNYDFKAYVLDIKKSQGQQNAQLMGYRGKTWLSVLISGIISAHIAKKCSANQREDQDPNEFDDVFDSSFELVSSNFDSIFDVEGDNSDHMWCKANTESEGQTAPETSPVETFSASTSLQQETEQIQSMDAKKASKLTINKNTHGHDAGGFDYQLVVLKPGDYIEKVEHKVTVIFKGFDGGNKTDKAPVTYFRVEIGNIKDKNGKPIHNQSDRLDLKKYDSNDLEYGTLLDFYPNTPYGQFPAGYKINIKTIDIDGVYQMATGSTFKTIWPGELGNLHSERVNIFLDADETKRNARFPDGWELIYRFENGDMVKVPNSDERVILIDRFHDQGVALGHHTECYQVRLGVRLK